MGLSINTNVAALNAARNLTTTQGALSKSLEKLSSGFRINRAADDAAGLAISEGMRSQIGGIKMGVRNAQDGISVVQTAEGALNETHSILQRMRDLSVQAANSGSLNDDAKANIQTEVDQLRSELGRIADTTQFNGKKLLDGKYTGTFQVGANVGETIDVAVTKNMSAVGLGVDTLNVATDASAGYVAGLKVGDDVFATGAAHTSTATYALFTDVQAEGTVTVNGKDIDLAGAVDLAAINTALTAAGAGATASWTAGTELVFTSTTSAATSDLTVTLAGATAAGTTTAATQAEVAANDLLASGADKSIKAIDKAISDVSTSRSGLGAVQNRFEHTINNLNVAVENLTASESRIRDTDMAAEMVNFTKSQILSQAGTAMLAQAKSIPQSVLQLLQ